MNSTPDLIGVAAAADICDITEAAMRKHVARGTCPPPLPIDGQTREALVWLRQTIIDWAETRRQQGQRRHGDEPRDEEDGWHELAVKHSLHPRRAVWGWVLAIGPRTIIDAIQTTIDEHTLGGQEALSRPDRLRPGPSVDIAVRGPDVVRCWASVRQHATLQLLGVQSMPIKGEDIYDLLAEMRELSAEVADIMNAESRAIDA